MKVKTRIHQIVQPAGPGDHLSRAFDVFILLLIALNVVALVLESVEPLREDLGWAFRAFEFISVMIFSVEYVLRLWSCRSDARYERPVAGRLRFAVTPLAVIDLLAVLPFYLPFVGLDLRFIRAIRLFRLFRLAKLGRYSAALQTLRRVFTSRKEELGITLFVLVLLLVMASCLMYFAEHEAQPKAFASIPDAMWWSVATLTTVGYGDVYPITPVGKLLAAMISILGIGMFALPTGILGAGFVEEVQTRRRGARICPHCGREITD